jgi:hypothetical protein
MTENEKKILSFFFEMTIQYPKYGYEEFHADFKSVERIEKKCTQKKLFAKNFCE